MNSGGIDLSCGLCGHRSESVHAVRCPVCNEGLEVDYVDVDLEARAASWPPALDRALCERYRAWLPDLGRASATLGEGAVPVIRSSVLADSGLREVYLAHEGMNPTGSFKDRGTVTALSFAVRAGFPRVGVVSSGNMACSVAAYAAAAGVRSVIIVSTDVPTAKLRATVASGGQVLRVDREHGALFFDVAALSLPDIAFLNSDHPFRLEGQKTAVFDLVARLEPVRPDVVVVPVSSGGNVLAIRKGLQELRAAGVLRTLPRLIGVQPEGCAPILAAYRQGSDRVAALVGASSIAGSISNPNPPAGNRVLAAARVGEIELVSVSDDEMLLAQRDLGATGVWVQPDSASVVAATRQLALSGAVRPRDTIACILTGAGHRDPTQPSEALVNTLTRRIAWVELGENLRTVATGARP